MTYENTFTCRGSNTLHCATNNDTTDARYETMLRPDDAQEANTEVLPSNANNRALQHIRYLRGYRFVTTPSHCATPTTYLCHLETLVMHPEANLAYPNRHRRSPTCHVLPTQGIEMATRPALAPPVSQPQWYSTVQHMHMHTIPSGPKIFPLCMTFLGRQSEPPI